MNKRALIAEPDPEEALRQAAILKDDGYDAIVFDPSGSGADLVTELEQNPPDILVLRHERPGSTTGFALVTRLKQVAPGTAIVITTSDLTPDAIEKNRRQKVHADGYLRLPVERTELVAAARAVPHVSEVAAAGAAVEEPVEADPKRPPPLPAAGLRALSQLPKASPRGGGGEAVLTAEDLTFVEKVFSTIQHIDGDAPVQEPPPSAIGDAGDRKVALLRSELKRRERELAKLSRLWKAREEDLRQKESRVHQKDIELEGLRLRISEVTAELERANREQVEKEAEFGRAMGESYDQTALEQAEYIQQVAKKENELNALKTKLRKAEDAWNAEKKEFTERVFEWEKAYADMEQHHWKVVEASVEEVQRLEAQVRQRESDRKQRDDVLRARELHIMSANQRIAALESQLRSVEHHSGIAEQEIIARAHGLLVQERNAAQAAQDEGHELRARLLDVEEDLARHQRLLHKLEKTRRLELVRMGSSIRAGDAERARLSGERAMFRDKSIELEQTLSLACALGEATAHQMFTLEEKRRIVGLVQGKVRDAKIGDLVEESDRLRSSLMDVTERLGQSEMEHAAELARAEDLDKALAETREQAADVEQRLARELEVMTSDRDKLTDNLQRTEQSLAQNKEEFTAAKSAHYQRELEVAALVEKKDHEISTKSERLQELDRSLSDAKEDIGNLRRTITLRDERITELLSRVRQADEQQVALEGKVHRLDSANQEKEADLISRDERIAQLALKLSQRDDELEETDASLRKSEALVLDKQALVERMDANIASLQAEIGRARDEGARLQGELQQRTNDLFDSERKGSTLSAELQNARADIGAGNAVAEQQQAQLKAAEQRFIELRRALEDSDGKLRNALVDLDSGGQRAEQMRVELAGLRERTSAQDRDLQLARGSIADLERMRDLLAASEQSLQARLDETEQDRISFEDALNAQARENGELHATLSDATVRLEEVQQRVVDLEIEVHDREGRIHAQGEVLERAEQQSRQQQQEIASLREDFAEAKHSVDDAKSAIDERTRWLQTREQTIAELKAMLDGEKQAKDQTVQQLQQLQQQATTLAKTHEQLKARLEDRERLVAAQAQHSEAQAAQASQRAEKDAQQLAAMRGQIEAAGNELGALRIEAQRAAEFRIAEEKSRADAQKLRTFAERAANELKAARAQLEKQEAARKQAEVETARLREEMAGITHAQKTGEQNVVAIRLEAEQRQARMQELTQQVQRLTAARDASERARTDAEQELARTKVRAEQELASGRGQLADEVARLQTELGAAKKARADAVAAAQQARAEAEQIKKLAAEKIKLAQASARGGTTPPVAAGPPRVPAPAAVPRIEKPGSLPGGLAIPASLSGLPVAAPGPMPPVTNPGFHMPTSGIERTMPSIPSIPSMPSMPSMPPGSGPDPFNEQKTILVEKPNIPSAARGDKG